MGGGGVVVGGQKLVSSTHNHLAQGLNMAGCFQLRGDKLWGVPFPLLDEIPTPIADIIKINLPSLVLCETVIKAIVIHLFSG